MVKLTIYALEQYDGESFNRGWLLNAGLNESDACELRCTIVHNAGLLPEQDVEYSWCDEPTLVSPDIEKGVISMQPEHWRQVNGLSNAYGEGAEVFLDLDE